MPSLLLTFNIFQTCSSVSIDTFEQVSTGWEDAAKSLKYLKVKMKVFDIGYTRTPALRLYVILGKLVGLPYYQEALLNKYHTNLPAGPLDIANLCGCFLHNDTNFTNFPFLKNLSTEKSCSKWKVLKNFKDPLPISPPHSHLVCLVCYSKALTRCNAYQLSIANIIRTITKLSFIVFTMNLVQRTPNKRKLSAKNSMQNQL